MHRDFPVSVVRRTVVEHAGSLVCQRKAKLLTNLDEMEIVVGIVQSVLDVGDIDPDRGLTEYGLDSVRALDIVIELEEAFNVTIEEEELTRLQTVRDIHEYLRQQIRSDRLDSL